jgi:hypothetical protein
LIRNAGIVLRALVLLENDSIYLFHYYDLNPLSAQKVALVSTIEHVRLPWMVNLNEEGTLFISADKKTKKGFESS